MKTLAPSRFTRIGVDRLIRLNWLERTASLVMGGNSDLVTKKLLQEDLKTSFQSSDVSVRGSIDKTITILFKVWVRPPACLKGLHARGLEFLAASSRSNRLAVHWGMVTAVYPFWSAVAIQVGRLLKLQNTVVASQIQRRVREQYGQRETVHRRVRYVLRSFVAWNVMTETTHKGIYQACVPQVIEDSKLIAWLVEAVLNARPDGASSLKDLMSSPALFPFLLKPMHLGELSSLSKNLEVFRQGLDQDLVILRKNGESRTCVQ